jgi:hypothetical protein
MSDLDQFVLNTKGLKNLILVHGEQDSMQAFATRMQHMNEDLQVIMPEREQVIEV